MSGEARSVAGVRPRHMAVGMNTAGGVSALCFARKRAIDMRKATWTTSWKGVTCKKCLKILGTTKPAAVTREVLEARARARCGCRQCANPEKHPCGVVLSIAIQVARDLIEGAVREAVEAERTELTGKN